MSEAVATTEIMHVPVKLYHTTRAKKLTRTKQKAILKEYAKHGNLSKACAINNVTRQAFWQLMQTNQQLKEAYQQIEDTFLDAVESTSLAVSLHPSREGFNDRKLLLQAKRPEIYGNKQEITSHVKVEGVIAVADVRNILSSYDAIDAEIVDSD